MGAWQTSTHRFINILKCFVSFRQWNGSFKGLSWLWNILLVDHETSVFYHLSADKVKNVHWVFMNIFHFQSWTLFLPRQLWLFLVRFLPCPLLSCFFLHIIGWHGIHVVNSFLFLLIILLIVYHRGRWAHAYFKAPFLCIFLFFFCQRHRFIFLL